jgi:hypothetical protein
LSIFATEPPPNQVEALKWATSNLLCSSPNMSHGGAGHQKLVFVSLPLLEPETKTLLGNTISRRHQPRKWSLVDGRQGKQWCGGPTPLVAPPS